MMTEIEDGCEQDINSGHNFLFYETKKIFYSLLKKSTLPKIIFEQLPSTQHSCRWEDTAVHKADNLPTSTEFSSGGTR